jgi:hypothetical protein
LVKVGIINLACLAFLAGLVAIGWIVTPSCDRDNEGVLRQGSAWTGVQRCVCQQIKPYACEWKGVDR